MYNKSFETMTWYW